ncbi:hypothetical protein D1872_258580 [compost metagenome]
MNLVQRPEPCQIIVVQVAVVETAIAVLQRNADKILQHVAEGPGALADRVEPERDQLGKPFLDLLHGRTEFLRRAEVGTTKRLIDVLANDERRFGRDRATVVIRLRIGVIRISIRFAVGQLEPFERILGGDGVKIRIVLFRQIVQRKRP